MNNIKKARIAAGLSQKYIALTLNVACPSVCNWERGKTSPTPEKLAALADLLGVTTDYLLGREEAQTKNASTPDPEAEARERLVSLMMDYTPEEIQRIMDFAAGIKAARK